MFIAESPKVIERALNAGYIPVSCLVEKRQIENGVEEVLEVLKMMQSGACIHSRI